MHSDKILKLTLIVMMGVSFLFVGCKKKEPEPVKQGAGLEVQELDGVQLQEKIKSNSGKVTIVNAWATWCTPCKEEMPHLIKLRNNYSDKFDLILLAIDEPEIVDSTIKPFLKHVGVDFTAYIKKDGDDEAFMNSVDSSWDGTLPATFVYNKDGVLVKKMISDQSYEKFEQALTEALK